jgi:hypothetical protein
MKTHIYPTVLSHEAKLKWLPCLVHLIDVALYVSFYFELIVPNPIILRD